MEPRPIQRGWADASLLLTTVLWGVNISVVKWAIVYADALTFNALRLVLATVALGLLTRLDRTPIVETDQPFPWGRAIGFALLSGVIYPFLFMFGVERTTAGNTALLLATMPIWTAGLSFIFLHERLPRLTWAGLGVSLMGTLLVIVATGKVSVSADHSVGNLLVLSAAMAWGAATVVSGPLLQRVSPLKLAFLTSLATTPIHLIVVAPKIPAVVMQLSDPQLFAAFAYSGALSTGVAYASWHYGVSKLGASHAAIYQNLVTLVAVATAWIFLGESLTGIQIVGGLILFAGLYLMRRGRKSRIGRHLVPRDASRRSRE